MPTNDINAQLTLLEMARRKNPDGTAARIAEVLNQANEVFGDIVWLEANGTTFHRVVRRTSLPTGTWRQLNSGVPTQSSTTETVDETIGLLENYSEADKWIIDNSPNPGEARMQEAAAVLEGMGQTFVKTIFNRSTTTNYGDVTVNPERFNGLPARLNVVQSNGLVLSQGGSGADTTSIYIVQWGPDTVHMVYPKGSQTVGIEHQDKGQVTVSTATSSRASTSQYEAYRDWFRINAGLVVRNPRSIARLANIETSGASNTFDEDNLIKLINRMWNRGRGAIIYCNETILTQMQIRLKDKNNVNYTAGGGDGLAGEDIIRFNGRPVRLVEQIGGTETAIS
jgi:hypothetical protein